jgi:diguanylate cyclase (GGDEF)-like protein
MMKSRVRENSAAYDQIRNAHKEVYALYEIARKFSSSLEIEKTLSVLMDKVGQLVPYDTCAVFLYDDVKGYASTRSQLESTQTIARPMYRARRRVYGFRARESPPVNRLQPSLESGSRRRENRRDVSFDGRIAAYSRRCALGALSLYSTTLREYTTITFVLLETVTRLASDALANAMHHAQTRVECFDRFADWLAKCAALHLRFEEEVSRARRNNKPFQVVMLDLDDFKKVNDTSVTRLAIACCAKSRILFRSQLREYDFLARYAGDEFVALLPDLTVQQVDELRTRIETSVRGFSLSVRAQTRASVGISIGASVFGADGEHSTNA